LPRDINEAAGTITLELMQFPVTIFINVPMETILITGSPGSGKTSTANCLAEIFREQKIHHIVIDPDEIARIFPEDSLSELKLDALAALHPLYVKMNVEKIIIPMTIDDDNDLNNVYTVFGRENTRVFKLIVAEKISIKRVVDREPNEYWKNKLSDIVRAYNQNERARTFECTDIHANNKSIADIALAIFTSQSTSSAMPGSNPKA